MEKIINFSPEGVVTSLHQDAFPLGFLGPQKIERATDITFNEATQLWNIRVLGARQWSTSYLSGFAGYDEARKFEVEWINQCMAQGYNWRGGDKSSLAIAEALRRSHDAHL